MVRARSSHMLALYARGRSRLTTQGSFHGSKELAGAKPASGSPARAYLVDLLSGKFSWVILLTIALVTRGATAYFAELHADETYYLFAARMIAEHGVPIFPSGMLWPAGGPLPYLEAPFVALFGVLSHWGRCQASSFRRFPCWHCITLGEECLAAWSRQPGPLLGPDPEAVLWGAYARQYSLFPLALFVTLYLVRRAAELGCAQGSGLVAALSFVFTLWVQPPAIFFVPASVVAYLVWLERIDLRSFFLSVAVTIGGAFAVWLYVSRGYPRLLESASTEGGALVFPPLASQGLMGVFQRYEPFFTAYGHREVLLLVSVIVLVAAAWSLSIARFDTPSRASQGCRDVLALGLFALVATAGLSFFRYGNRVMGCRCSGRCFCLVRKA